MNKKTIIFHLRLPPYLALEWRNFLKIKENIILYYLSMFDIKIS